MTGGYFKAVMESILGDEDPRPIVRLRFSQAVWDYFVAMDKGKSDFGVVSFEFQGIPAVLDPHIPDGHFVKDYA